MIVRSTLRDCLYLNWALPVESLPDLPEPLRYETHLWRGGSHVFASALLFRNERLQLAGLPFPRFAYPQFNLRLYVLDGADVPSVFFRCLLVPGWVAPGARWISRQPLSAARFQYPRPSDSPAAAGWRWRVQRRRTIEVAARQASPAAGRGPALGSWEQTTGYFVDRRRGYVETPDGRLKQIEASHRGAAAWPLEVSVDDDALLSEFLPLADLDGWPALHSAWLCPEIPFVFELGEANGRKALARPAPVATDPAMFGPRRSVRSRRSAA